MRLVHMFWSYFREAQPPLVRVVHMIALVLVLVQLLSSNLIRFDAAGHVSGSPFFFMGSWAHFSFGIVLVLAGFLFMFLEIARYGVRYFFPYLWKDFSQLKADLKTLCSRRLLIDPWWRHLVVTVI